MLRLRPAARDDLDAAARWYEAQESGLGRQFLAEVRLVFQRIRSNPAAPADMESRVGSARVNPSSQTNRTPRSNLSGSSVNRASASPTARTTFDAMSSLPPQGSWSSPVSRLTAIAFMVKSRRARSSSSDVPNWTVGFRVPS